jgi:hypothetical protein
VRLPAKGDKLFASLPDAAVNTPCIADGVQVDVSTIAAEAGIRFPLSPF